MQISAEQIISKVEDYHQVFLLYTVMFSGTPKGKPA